MPLKPFPKLVVFLAIPVATAVSLTTYTYLHHNPLSASRSRSIKTSTALSPSCAFSPSLRIVNPKNHPSWTDSNSIRLSARDIGTLTNKEILARSVRGFFGGWAFAPEMTLFNILGLGGVEFLKVGFSDIESPSPQIDFPEELSKTSPPEVHSLLFKGHFMLLDGNVRSRKSDTETERKGGSGKGGEEKEEDDDV